MQPDSLGNMKYQFKDFDFKMEESITEPNFLKSRDETEKVASKVFGSFNFSFNDETEIDDFDFTVENAKEDVLEMIEDCDLEAAEGTYEILEGEQEILEGYHEINEGSHEIIEGNQEIIEGVEETIEGDQEIIESDQAIEKGIQENIEGTVEKKEAQKEELATDQKEKTIDKGVSKVYKEEEITFENKEEGELKQIESKDHGKKKEVLDFVGHKANKVYSVTKNTATEARHIAKENLVNTKICIGDLRTSELISIIELDQMGHHLSPKELAQRVQFRLDKPGYGFAVVPRKSGRKAGVEFERNGILWKVIYETKEEEIAFFNAWNTYLNAIKRASAEKKDETEKHNVQTAIVERNSKLEDLDDASLQQHKNPLARDLALEGIREERKIEKAKEKRYLQKKEIDKEELQKELRAQFMKQKNLIHNNIVRTERLQLENSDMINKQNFNNLTTHKVVKAY